jgi:hypothetical protein
MSKPDEDGFTAFHLKECKVFLPRDMRDDAVLLRVRTDRFETWYRLHREDFIALAEYLANDAAQMRART